VGDQEAGHRVVSAGGGIEAVIEATELRTLNNIARLDPVIVTRASDNDLLERAQPPVDVTWRRRPRRLVPDPQLLWRRAAGEPLQALASDYDVAHCTLSRFFARAEVKTQLRQTAHQLRAKQRARPAHRSLRRQ
jgi:hypothetical protein